MQADHALGVGRDRGDVLDVEGGGVRAEDRGRLADLAEALEDAALDLEVLEDRLHHQVDVGQLAPVAGAAQVSEDLLDLRRLEDAALDALLEGVADDPEAALDLGVVEVDQDHRVALGGDLLGDAGAHVAGSDDGEFFDLVGAHGISFSGCTAADAVF